MKIEVVNNDFNDYYINLYRNEKINEYDYLIVRITDDFFSNILKKDDVYLLFKVNYETKKYRKYKLLNNLTPLYFLLADKRNKLEGEKYLSIYFISDDEYQNILDTLEAYQNNFQNDGKAYLQQIIYDFLQDKNPEMKMYVYIKYLY